MNRITAIALGLCLGAAGPALGCTCVVYGDRLFFEDQKTGDIVATQTSTTCCLCGLEVKATEQLLVYAFGVEPLALSTCSRTSDTGRNSADIAVIERILRGEPAHEIPIVVPEPNIAFKADVPERTRR